MARPKRDPNLATVSYNAQNVERAIGYFTALTNTGDKKYDAMIAETTEYYSLTPIESAMLTMGITNLIAPQFRDKSAVIAENVPVEPLVEKASPEKAASAKPAK